MKNQDILCKVREESHPVSLQVVPQDSPPDLLTFLSVEYRDDLAILTIAVPESLLTSFQDFLRSAISFSNYVQTKVRVEKATLKARDVAEQEMRQKQFEKYQAAIVAKFDSFVNAGLTPRQAIRETKAFFNKNEKYLTCYTIELIVRAAGRLSKRRRKE